MRNKFTIVCFLLSVLLSSSLFAQTYEWVKSITDNGENYTMGVANDKLGNTYTTGKFKGTINVGNSITLTSNGDFDIFIIKYNSAGDVVWAKSAGGPYTDKPQSIAVDSYGNAYITGDFDRNMTVGGYNMVSLGSGDIFIIKYTPEGDLDWAQQAGGSGWDEGLGLSIDKYENVYATGYFRNTAQFGKAPNIVSITSAGGQDAFVAKYDPFGILQWVKREGDIYDNYGKAIAVSADDNVFFGQNNISTSEKNTSLYKYAGIDGSSIWGVSLNMNAFLCNSLCVDKNNNCYVVGGAGNYNTAYFAYLWKVNNAGAVVFNKFFGSRANTSYLSNPTKIVSDNNNELYISGTYIGPFNYDSFSINSNGWNGDGYLVKIGADGTFRWFQRINDNSQQSMSSVSVNDSNYIFATCNFIEGVRVGRWGISAANNTSLIAKLNQKNPFTVIYPNGGEKLRLGDSVSVIFDNQNAFNVDLLWTRDNGLSWTLFADNLAVSQGNNLYKWSGPDLPSTVCKIAFREHDNYGLIDYSDNVFTAARLNITAPASLTYWPVVSSQAIRWESVNIDKIKIEYSIDNGATWALVTDTVSAAGGVYNWLVPNTLTTQARIRLSDASTNSVTTTSPIFGIVPNVKLISPNGTEVWQIGTSQEIKWTSISALNLKLEYTTNGGTSWLLIDSSVVASSGKYIWNVPKTPSDNCLMRITDNAIPQGTDVSDAAFSIPIPNITVLAPTEGDSWLVGSTKQIKWISYGVDNVRIQYSLNNGITNTNILTSLPAVNGVYSWVVPNSPTKQLRIKVLDASNGSLFGWSMANSISPLVLSNLRGGEYLNVGETAQINWEQLNINNIKIEYTTNNGINWLTVADNLAASSGTYNWTVPNTVSSICKLRLTDLSNVNTYDVSKSTFTIIARVTQPIVLNAGWNLISSYVKARYTTLDSVLAFNKSNIVIMKNSKGQVYYPGYNINTIGNWAVEDGYLIKVTTSDTLKISGGKISPESYPINIPAGWSMISYLRTSAMAISTAMQPVLANLIIVKDGDGNVYYPSQGVNSIGNMLPGKGYQVKFSSPSVLTYTANSLKSFEEEITKTSNLEHFNNIIKTDRNSVIVLSQNAINNILTIGDEVGVFTSEGLLVGSAKFEGSNFAVTVWGDDATTTVKEGMAENEAFVIKIWKKAGNIERLLTNIPWSMGDGKYKTDGISTIGLITSVESSDGPKEYQLLQNYPNPFNPSTVIKFAIPALSNVRLEVYNIIGEKICELVNKEMSAGNYEVKFDASKLSSGIYFYKLKSGQFVSIKKMLLVK